MQLLTPPDRILARALSRIAFVNPFLAERVDLERRALGGDYIEVGAAKALLAEETPNPNTLLLVRRAETLLATVRQRAAEGAARPTDADRTPLAGLGLFVLYHRYWERLERLARQIPASGSRSPVNRRTPRVRVPWAARFFQDFEHCLRLGDEWLEPQADASHLLAIFFQMARAFDHVYAHIAGHSAAAVQLRADIWQSVFTCDLERYRKSLTSRMADVPTLVTGPTGTGKELVAQAVGSSGFVPFDLESQSFELDTSALFLPVNLSACSPNLIESELFGHRRGAFTGAQEDRVSWFEQCAPYGAVFLDELSETEPEIQVKLLRVLQSREFQRVGELETRRFEGRLITATNRDLVQEIEAGRFREDLFYRVCADQIVTPRLADLIAGDAEELQYLLTIVAQGLLGVAESDEDDRGEAEVLASQARSWIESELGLDYAWPGNFRELEQCTRAVLVRGAYRPGPRTGEPELARALEDGLLTADQLLNRYCARVYARTGTYEGAARRLGLDRRTVKSRVLANREAVGG